MFKKKRAIKIPYVKQGLIYFTCLDVKDQPMRVQNKILNLCVEVAGEDYKALYELLTNERANCVSVSLKYNPDNIKGSQEWYQQVLGRYRKNFYEKYLSN